MSKHFPLPLLSQSSIFPPFGFFLPSFLSRILPTSFHISIVTQVRTSGYELHPTNRNKRNFNKRTRTQQRKEQTQTAQGRASHAPFLTHCCFLFNGCLSLQHFFFTVAFLGKGNPTTAKLFEVPVFQRRAGRTISLPAPPFRTFSFRNFGCAIRRCSASPQRFLRNGCAHILQV